MSTLIPKYTQGATGAVNRPINLKLAETVSVKDFGAVGDGTTDDTAAINAALTAAYCVHIPTGTYKITSTLFVTDGKQLYGDGGGTIIKPTLSSGSSAISVGRVANNGLDYNCIVRDLTITPQSASIIGVTLFSTVNANISNVLINGDPALVTGFRINGGASSFFNLFQNCYALHCHIGFDIMTTGASFPTQQIFVDCSAFGDYPTDTTSVGYLFRTNAAGGGCGLDTSIFGGNIESCGCGISLSGAFDPLFPTLGNEVSGVNCNGVRFEANGADIVGGVFNTNCTFIGCRNLLTITGLPSAADGYGNNTFFGNSYSTPADAVNYIEAATTIYAPKTTARPLQLNALAGQTAALLYCESGTGTTLSQLNANGSFNVVSQAIAGAVGSITYGGGAPSTTVGAAGGASALPATPLGYIIAYVGATQVKIPYYVAS